MQEGASTSGLLDAVTNYRNTLGYAGLDSIDERKAGVVSYALAFALRYPVLTKDMPRPGNSWGSLHTKNSQVDQQER